MNENPKIRVHYSDHLSRLVVSRTGEAWLTDPYADNPVILRNSFIFLLSKNANTKINYNAEIIRI